MARDYFDESKNKKKVTKKKTEDKKPQSSSVTKPKTTAKVDKVASKSTFLGGGASTQKVEQAVSKPKQTKPKKNPKEAAQSAIQRSSKSTAMGGTAKTKTQRTKRDTSPVTSSQRQKNAEANMNLKQRNIRDTTPVQSRRTATTTAAQRQKMGMPTQQDLKDAKAHRRELANNINASVRETSSETNKGFMQRQKSGTLTTSDKKRIEQTNQRRAEVARNTRDVAKKAVIDTGSGYAQSLYDLTELTASNKNGTKAKAMKMGLDPVKNRRQIAELEREQKYTAAESKRRRDELFQKQEQRQAEWDERTKNAKGLEKAWYGAVESGTGMVADTLVGAATGTGQFGALASMGLRTYGSSANQARKEGATDKEARLYGLAQSAKEVGTELMFQGAGLAKAAYGRTGLSLADKSANILTRGLTGLKADAVGAGVRALGGTAEENIEELAGWMADPLIKELTYGKAVRNRMKENLRANIPQIGSDADAANVASYFSTPKFTNDLTNEYVKSGMSKDKASALAAEMRDYYVAYYSGDKGRLDALEEDLAAKLSGQDKLSFRSWSMDELKDTFASTTLLTLATGLPGAVTTSVKGNQIFDSDEVKAVFGNDAVRKVADAVKNTSNREMSLKAETMEDRLNSGKDLTGTQKYDLYQGYIEKVNETSKKARASQGVVENARREQNLVPTMGVDRAGNTVYAKETQREYDEKYAETAVTAESLRRFMESDNSISDDEIRRTDAAIKAVSDLHVGGLTIGDAHEFAYGNNLARETLKAEEGIDLDRYIVRKADGTVDLAATNEATENALFRINADNAIKAAQAETEVFIDDTRGNIDKDLLTRFGNNGQAVWKEVNKDLDPRNLQEYLTNANAASYFYSAGRNTDMGVDSAINRFADTFKTVDKSLMKRAFAAGARDRIIANTPGYGQTVESGSNIQLKKTEPVITGQLIMDDDVVLADSDQSAYLALAMSTNTNIHIVSSMDAMGKDGKPIINQATGLPVQINGMSHGNDIYLNMNEASEKNLGYVFMHEMTHQIKQYAPNEYLALENLVRDRWFNKDATGMQAAIKQRMDLYSVKGGQQLTEEEAVEEIIADAMAEAMDDPEFAAQVCEEDINLGQAILNSIRAALRSIRQMFANIENPNDRFHNSLLSYLGILDQAEKMWLNALATAKQNKADGLIADWQDKANKQNAPRLSVSDEELERIKAKKRTNKRDREILRDAGEKLKENDFYSLYSAHKLDLRGEGNVAEQVESIKANGFMGDAGFGHNVIPSVSSNVSRVTVDERRAELKGYGLSDEQIDESINRLRENPGAGVWADENTYIPSINATQLRYAGKKGETVLLVPEHHVYKGERVINGFKPFDYEVVTVERDFQPYYELYSKAYDEAHEGRYSITLQQDADYMDAVEAGDMETAQRMVDEAAAAAMPYTKLKGRWYHGTENEFTEFNFSQGGKNGTADGFGIYLTNDPEVASSYGNRMIKGYVNVTRPASALTSQTLTKSELRRLIKRTVEDEALQMAEDYDSNIEEAKFDTWISNYTDTRYAGNIDKAIDEVIKGITSYNGNDMDIIQEIMVGMGIRNYDEATRFYDILTEETGIDGLETKWGDESEMADPNTPTIALAFRSNQIKSADPVTYAEDGSVIPLSERFDSANNDIRYSLPTQDADGKILTDGQMEYFKNSQARDIMGRLVPVYHTTTTGGFTIFDPSYSEDQRSIFFTDSEAVSKTYGTKDSSTTYECYLNFENPLIIDADYNAWDRIPMTRRIGSITMTEDYDTIEVAAFAYAEGYDSVIIRNCRDWAVDDSSDFDSEENSPYSDIYIAFSSNQVKDINNENPTENPDIRYSITPEDEAMSKMANDFAFDNSYERLEYYESIIDEDLSEEAAYEKAKRYIAEDVDDFYAGLTRYADGMRFDDPVLEEGRVRMAKSKQDYFNSNVAKWNQNWLTDGEVLDIESVKKPIKDLVMANMMDSNTSKRYKADLVKKMAIDMRLAYYYAKQGRTDVADALLWHSAFRMVDGVEFYADDGNYETYKNLRDYFRNTNIQLGEEYWSDTDYAAFRKANYGRINLVKGKTNLDKVLDDLYHENPDGSIEGIAVEWFSPEAFEKNDHKIDSVPDILLQIADVLDDVEPYAEAYSSDYCADWATDLASSLLDIMANGKELQSTADKYRNRYEEKVKAMKARHAEAMLKVRQQKADAVRKEKLRLKEYVEKKKEQQAHKTYFDRIKETYDSLVERLSSNTADKHIPEQYKKELAKLLAAFDLQTVGSKARQARTGHIAKNTIRMAAIKEALMSIEDRTEMFHVNDAITDLMDELSSVEGQTLDSLSATELWNIDRLLKSLLHEFNRYEKVRIGAKNLQAADLADAQVHSALEHARIFGPGNDYRGPKGWIDQIINMDEMTPAYLFKRIDPDNVGLGLMWKEIRRSQDKYIRNTEQINKWMEEITGKYKNRGRFGKKYGSDEIEKWRSSNYQQTYNLTNGTVQLTPAQAMSLYCLSKRNQAYGHMVGAGVVVAPVSFQAKIMSDLKKKINRSLPVILTDADIKTVVSQLTPEQIQVADKLQELMSTKMADLGNEASMNVLGIKLFNESDYFPIKSDKAALERDLTNEQFENAIRNFGFTKAVQPGARNAIMIEDIFDVVTEHCNNMNLYNSYSETLNDFMKVFNKHSIQENGADYSVRQALAHAYSSKATTFIMEFIRDLNGNTSRGRTTGIETAMNDTLANAKKASVFANLRVLAQQPTAITRAFAVISPKYLKGVSLGDIAKGIIPTVTTKDMQEMFDHCPIALWKSWGYYDINMGKSIESVIMNEGNWLEDMATQAYGKADNITWTAIWQMVKAETKDLHPELKEGTDEYWEHCNERMSEIVDFTQVVDSPLHRSHAMRAKDIVHKTMTSFMAEPTLTFNMIRDGWIRAREAWIKGDKSEAAKILGKTASVAGLQAATVAAAAAVVDALRGKNPGGGDGDEDKSLWLINFLNNLKDEMKIWNKIYYIKDLASIAEGWDNANLALQGWKTLYDGFKQFDKKTFEGSKVPWWKIYYNLLGGIGYFTGIPFKTLMKDGRAIFELLGGELPESLVGDEKTDSVVSSDSKLQSLRLFKGKGSSNKETVTSAVRVGLEDKWYDYENNPITVKDGSTLDKLLNHFGINLTASEKAQIAASQAQQERDSKAEEISNKYADLSGEEKDKKVWSSVTTYYKNQGEDSKVFADMVANGDYGDINEMKSFYLKAGGNAEYFDKRVLSESKKALKKSIKYGQTNQEIDAQERVKNYMLSHGMTEQEVSEIVYKSDTAKDMKVAFRLNDKDLMMETLEPLVNAGLTYEDLERLWENRNRMQLSSYNGRYKDKLKSTGKFIWPTDGVITSHFGYRNAPTAGASSNHPAIDIGAPQGTAVVAADGGVVISAGANGGYGNSVGIKHDNGMITWYNHLYDWNVKVGDTVAQGQQIAQVGSTGISTGPHLDFKIMDTDGNPVDPEKYLEAR